MSECYWQSLPPTTVLVHSHSLYTRHTSSVLQYGLVGHSLATQLHIQYVRHIFGQRKFRPTLRVCVCVRVRVLLWYLHCTMPNANGTLKAFRYCTGHIVQCPQVHIAISSNFHFTYLRCVCVCANDLLYCFWCVCTCGHEHVCVCVHFKHISDKCRLHIIHNIDVKAELNFLLRTIKTLPPYAFEELWQN